MTLVSVIMPSYNSEAFIRGSIESVLRQTHQDLELIIVDDGSNDTTVGLLEVFQKEDARVQIQARSACSGGPATPRNQAMQIAKGDYLAFIDSDDQWHPQKLALQIKFMQENELNFLSSEHIPFRKMLPNTDKVDANTLTLIPQNHANLIKKNTVVTSSAIMSKSIINGIMFNEAPQYIGVEDYLTWLYLHQKPDIKSAILTSPLVFYRQRQDSISSSKLAMAKKIFYLLSHYQYQNQPLGWHKYYYFLTYTLGAFSARLKRLLTNESRSH